jgi:hypothetical protein
MKLLKLNIKLDYAQSLTVQANSGSIQSVVPAIASFDAYVLM